MKLVKFDQLDATRPILKIVIVITYWIYLLNRNKGDFVFSQEEIEETGQIVIDKPQMCGSFNGTGIDLLVLVNSGVGHFLARAAIRATWGKYMRDQAVSVFFLLASSNDLFDQEMIKAEDSKNGDIIQAAILDNYRNLTLKSLVMLRLVAQRCERVKFVLKVDDDVVLNAKWMVDFVRSTNCRNAFLGRLAQGWAPLIEPTQKNYCPLSCYRGLIYPDFVVGPAYMFDPKVAQPILQYALHDESVMYVEDVYISGIAAQALNIPRYRLYFHEYFIPENSCEFSLGVVWTECTPENIRDMWQLAHTVSNETCPISTLNMTAVCDIQ